MLGVRMRLVLGASRGAAAIVVAIFTIAARASIAVAETDCKSWILGICTSYYTPVEQAEINARKQLEAVLRDPARAGPLLEQRLRKQVRYSNGLLLIEDPILHGITTLPATAGWSISCDENLGMQVIFGAGGENGGGTEVELVPLGTRVQRNACFGLSELLGAAVLRLLSGQ
jgi:hypothetical protein